MNKLRDPEQCPACKSVGHFRVVDSRRRGTERTGFYRRRLHCCKGCGHKWPAFLNTINPRNVHAA